MELFLKYMQTPAGDISLYANNHAVTGILWGKNNNDIQSWKYAGAKEKDNEVLLAAAGQIETYFAGGLKEFDIPLEISGTDFQKAVWEVLRSIGYGEVRTYAEVAAEIGNPKACRAVGGAIGRNPISIIIPCHRVIGSNGTLTGFGGGLPAKRSLLETEGHRIKNSRINK